MRGKLVEKREWYRILWGELERQEQVRTAVVVDGRYTGARIFWADGQAFGTMDAPMEFWESAFWNQEQPLEPGIREMGGSGEQGSVFVELLSRRPRLVIFGGGHISLPLCAMGRMLDFHVTVMDDRPEYADRGRFKEADEVICASFSQVSALVADVPNTYYVIVTRGHLGDTVCAEQILRRKCAYVGMIGSRAKVEKTKQALEQAGIPADRIDALYAPIGLKIGGQTPAEIAVSIMAQIIQVRHETATGSLDAAIGAWLAEDSGERAVMAEVIEKNGSAPRGAGSRMLICPDGRSLGSVGGGAAEYEVKEAAGGILTSRVMEFWMDGRESASAGMVCGGRIRVLLERI